MGFRVVRPDELEWITRPHEPGEPARHVAELSDFAGFAHTREMSGATSREPRAAVTDIDYRKRPSSSSQGRSRCTSAIRRNVRTSAGALIHIDPGTALQATNHGTDELVLYATDTRPRTSTPSSRDSAAKPYVV